MSLKISCENRGANSGTQQNYHVEADHYCKTAAHSVITALRDGL
jgi:hypothetical protein